MRVDVLLDIKSRVIAAASTLEHRGFATDGMRYLQHLRSIPKTDKPSAGEAHRGGVGDVAVRRQGQAHLRNVGHLEHLLAVECLLALDD